MNTNTNHIYTNTIKSYVYKSLNDEKLHKKKKKQIIKL